MAQIIYVYDSACIAPEDVPRSIPALLDWVKRNPGRLAHPTVRNFLSSTFLKQALYERAPGSTVLQQPAAGANFAPVTARFWAWYDELKPLLWRGGKEFPESGPVMRQLLNDGELDMMISFNPGEAAVSIANNLLPDSARVFVMVRGTIGNTSFVATPYNAAQGRRALAPCSAAPVRLRRVC
jgi:putative thiamine transport system substrate-binding protein